MQIIFIVPLFFGNGEWGTGKTAGLQKTPLVFRDILATIRLSFESVEVQTGQKVDWTMVIGWQANLWSADWCCFAHSCFY